MEATWRLRRNYRVLDNERKIVEALTLAIDKQPGTAPWVEGAQDLLGRVCAEVFATCLQIARDSELAEGAEDEL